ncbi:MAG TPA: UDP-N-acetylmuramoyl-L-alanine--D-glutamate ligase [Clostridia bacterium]|jgi:UDP-N-acetylmuramoylalanine--D-glutamate ligase|nr:UDP-N-acetylmuramoyl-L-alanine--D-glutamate ligase [Clostridiaceae bacterium]HOF26033.1 UDP-N-acetylmuramoyl-L-alanine--D-glutamate ligase [Clostridia bacterium]HOR89210.1 UDP-N-acetylmuramoyl-L-alanine--D-glutamate ligase [Clostridia bacterium]HPL07407.1 UDP-N-acetylmuramoyl-L-alanine--D-glutamate ligase [Clostridia bacterium]
MKKNDFKNHNEYIEYLKTMKVAVVGLGIGNINLFKHLAKKGVHVTGFDKNDDFTDLRKYIEEYPHASLITGPDYLDKLAGYDVIFKTQSMKRDLPQFLDAIKSGATLTSEMWEFIKYCNAKIIAVTGSSGKTTTTTLIGELLKQQGYKVWVGGNIGTPLFHRLDDIDVNDYVVLELASCQLQMFCNKSPNISVITNITPNHLDFHDDYDEYIYCKSIIFKYQKSDDIIILNQDNDITRQLRESVQSKAYMFSMTEKYDKENSINGAYLHDNAIYVNIDKNIKRMLDVNDIKIPGRHNIENYMAAILATYSLVEQATVKHVATTFNGVEHRVEYVRTVNGVRFYNDSIGTTPSRTVASLHCFDKKVILIAGGYDKNISYDIMGPLINEKVKGLVLMGQTKEKIKQAYTDYSCTATLCEASTMEEAVRKAFNMAKEGDIIILSPASAAFDMFKNFEVKGNIYKQIVNSL